MCCNALIKSLRFGFFFVLFKLAVKPITPLFFCSFRNVGVRASPAQGADCGVGRLTVDGGAVEKNKKNQKTHPTPPLSPSPPFPSLLPPNGVPRSAAHPAPAAAGPGQQGAKRRKGHPRRDWRARFVRARPPSPNPRAAPSETHTPPHARRCACKGERSARRVCRRLFPRTARVPAGRTSVALLPCLGRRPAPRADAGTRCLHRGRREMG